MMQNFARAFLTLCLCSAALAQTQVPAKSPSSSEPPATNTTAASPVGHWIADHSPQDSLALWWDFRADGSVTVTAGALSQQKYRLDNATLTITSLDGAQTTGVFDIHFADGKLYTVAHADHPPTIEYTRIAAPANSESPIVGTWKVSNAPHAVDPEQEKLRNRMMNMIVVYGADGSYEARTPLNPVQGRWDTAAQTYTLKDFPPLHFERDGDNLKIALPPEGKETHIYRRDTLLDQRPQP
jgi:hypothetical protein